MLTLLRQLLCPHKNGNLTKTKGRRVYVECMDCGKTSSGVIMGKPRKARKAGTRIDLTVMHSGPVPVFIPKKRARA